MRLIAGDTTIPLGSATLPRPGQTSDSPDEGSIVVALSHDVEIDDLSVEVEYDGLTQIVDVASGEIDAGVAQALYVPLTNFDADCVRWRTTATTARSAIGSPSSR